MGADGLIGLGQAFEKVGEGGFRQVGIVGEVARELLYLVIEFAHRVELLIEAELNGRYGVGRRLVGIGAGAGRIDWFATTGAAQFGDVAGGIVEVFSRDGVGLERGADAGDEPGNFIEQIGPGIDGGIVASLLFLHLVDSQEGVGVLGAEVVELQVIGSGVVEGAHAIEQVNKVVEVGHIFCVPGFGGTSHKHWVLKMD